MRMLLKAAFIALVYSASAATAHEFWLSPEKYQVETGESIQVRLRVGQFFKGASYIYNPRNFLRFDVVQETAVMPVPGRMGDDPAVDLVAADPGLFVLVHETTDSTLNYTEWDKFTAFVAHKDFPGVLEAHAARGLPQTGFRESYRRYAKTLMAVGSGAGADRQVGLRTEIVAMANPYTDDLSAGMPLRVLFEGAPRVDAQVEVFSRPPEVGADVTVNTYRTDAEGRVTVPVMPGHEYLVDAVILEDTGNDDVAAGPVWHSLWASLTFAVPAQ